MAKKKDIQIEAWCPNPYCHRRTLQVRLVERKVGSLEHPACVRCRLCEKEWPVSDLAEVKAYLRGDLRLM
jgi:hypothetical protein